MCARVRVTRWNLRFNCCVGYLTEQIQIKQQQQQKKNQTRPSFPELLFADV